MKPTSLSAQTLTDVEAEARAFLAARRHLPYPELSAQLDAYVFSARKLAAIARAYELAINRLWAEFLSERKQLLYKKPTEMAQTFHNPTIEPRSTHELSTS